MQFSIDDKVMHPQYGPGQIVGVEHRELVEGFEHYYVIELLADNTLYVPIRKMDELGVRRVMSQAKFARVLDTLRSAPRRLSKDFRERQQRIREKVATARPIKVAEAVRDLTGRRQRGHLTKVDRDLLKRARELLAAEMAMATGTDILHAHRTMDTALMGRKVHESDVAEPVRVYGTALTSEQQTLVEKLLKRINGGRADRRRPKAKARKQRKG